jgi:hypothetical protein
MEPIIDSRLDHVDVLANVFGKITTSSRNAHEKQMTASAAAAIHALPNPGRHYLWITSSVGGHKTTFKKLLCSDVA